MEFRRATPDDAELIKERQAIDIDAASGRRCGLGPDYSHPLWFNGHTLPHRSR
jgi:hypothetical protein